MFEATLASTQPDRLRTQRLMLATLISVGMTSIGLAGSWTLERLGVDRVGGPRSDFELIEYSLLPPKPIDPPPPPPNDQGLQGADGPDSIEDIVETPTTTSIAIPPPTRRIPDIGSSGDGGGIPDGGGGTCRPPLCGLGTNSALTGGDGCVGPNCGVARRPDPPPAEVSFSALSCIVCPDPDDAQLRRTSASMRKRAGDVALRFCVNERGRVEAGSIDITRSFGDADVDRITRSAVAGWRFKPMQVAGAPRRACSEATFRITFD
jgi:TonB family protein